MYHNDTNSKISRTRTTLTYTIPSGAPSQWLVGCCRCSCRNDNTTSVCAIACATTYVATLVALRPRLFARRSFVRGIVFGVTEQLTICRGRGERSEKTAPDMARKHCSQEFLLQLIQPRLQFFLFPSLPLCYLLLSPSLSLTLETPCCKANAAVQRTEATKKRKK